MRELSKYDNVYEHKGVWHFNMPEYPNVRCAYLPPDKDINERRVYVNCSIKKGERSHLLNIVDNPKPFLDLLSELNVKCISGCNFVSE